MTELIWGTICNGVCTAEIVINFFKTDNKGHLQDHYIITRIGIIVFIIPT